jgi:hypothetical protein
MQRHFITPYSLEQAITLLRAQIDVEPVRWLYTKPFCSVYGTLTSSSFRLRRRHPQWMSDPHGMYLQGDGRVHSLGTVWTVTAHENVRRQLDRAVYWTIGVPVSLGLMSVSIAAWIRTGILPPMLVITGLGALGMLIISCVLNRMQRHQNQQDETYLWAFVEQVLSPLPDSPATDTPMESRNLPASRIADAR